jgi:outer membrane protein assembly factor BamB
MKNLIILLSTLLILLTSSRCNPEPQPVPTPDGLTIPKLVWKSPISSTLTSSICPIVHGDYALFSRAILSDSTDPIIAFDKNTGKKLWEWNDYKKSGSLSGYRNSYYAYDNVATITQGSQVYAIDLRIGKTLWQNRVSDAAMENVVGIGATIFHEKLKETNGSYLPYLAKCNIRTGQWQTIFTDSLMLNFTQRYEISEPFINAVGDTMLTFMNGAYRLPGNPGGEKSLAFIYLFNVSKNKLIYKIEINPGSSLTRKIRNNKIYILQDAKKILCWDIEKGQVSSEILGTSSYYGNITLEDNKIFVTTAAGIQGYDADSGTLLWTSNAFETKNLVSNFDYFNGVLYFSSGWLYAIDATSGKQLMHYADNKNGEAAKGYILKLNVDKASKRIYIGNNLEALCYETIK